MGNPKSSSKTGHTGRWPTQPVAPDSKPPHAGGERPAGRIVHDERGNAVWNWTDPSRIAVDSTSAMLKRLEVPELSVEGQEEMPANAPARTHATMKDTSLDRGGGYNPYDQRKAIRKPTTPKGPVGRRGR